MLCPMHSLGLDSRFGSGPAPFAKLETQRHRRLNKAGGADAKKKGRKKLSTLNVTPGTVFMASVDSALLGWAEARVAFASTSF